MGDMSNNLSNEDLRDHLGQDFDADEINSQPHFSLSIMHASINRSKI